MREEASRLPGVPCAHHRAEGRLCRSLALSFPAHRTVCGRRRGRGDMAGVGQAGSAAAEVEQHLNGELPPEPEDKDGAEGGAAGHGAEDGTKKKRKKKKKGKAGPAGRGRAAPGPSSDRAVGWSEGVASRQNGPCTRQRVAVGGQRVLPCRARVA